MSPEDTSLAAFEEIAEDFISEDAEPESEQTEGKKAVESEQSETEAVEPEETIEEVVDDVPQLPDTLEELATLIELDGDDLKSLGVTFEVNGETRSTTIREALEQIAQSEAVTVQSDQLAESQRSHNEHVQQATAMWTDRLQRIDAAVEALEADIEEGPDLNLLLAEGDTEGYLQAQAREKERGQRLQNARSVRQQAIEEDRSRREQDLSQHRGQQGQILLGMYPELNDTAKAQAFDREIESGAALYGFSIDEFRNYMGGKYDAREVRILRDAIAFRSAQDKQPALKRKLKELPKVRKPGAVREAGEIGKDKRANLKARLRKSGGAEDAAADYFADIMNIKD